MQRWNGYDLPRVLVPALWDKLGLTRAAVRHQIERGRWTPMARGAVLTSIDVPLRADWADLGIAMGGPSATLSGWDVAHLLGVAPRIPPSSEVLVLSRHSSNRVVGRVRVRETHRPYISTLLSVDSPLPLIPVASASRAIADTALLYRSPDTVRGMITRAVQRGVVDLSALIADADTAPRQGSHNLRLALADVRQGARSLAEAKAAEQLRRRGIPPFELNVPILDRAGRVVYIADVLWRDLRAILEVDSREFHFSETDWKKTMMRHNVLTALGYSVTHYSPSVVMGPGTAWVDEVRRWLDQRRVEVARAATSRC